MTGASLETPVAGDALAAEQAALRRVATLVARGAAEQEVFAAVNQEIGRIVGVGPTSLFRFDPEDTLTLLAAWDDDDAEFPVGDRRPLNAELRELRDTARARRFDVLPEGAPFLCEARERGVSSAVGVPVIVEGAAWGVVFAASNVAEPLPHDTASRLAAFTELLAVALSNAEAHASLQLLADEQAALRRVAELVARGGDQEAVFAAVAREASALLGGEPMTLSRFEGERGLVAVAVERGPVPVGWRLEYEPETLPDWVRRRATAVRIDDYAEQRDAELAVRVGIVAGVAVPILVDGQVWGMLTATSRSRPLPQDTERRLQEFARMITAALANADARARLQELADEQAALRRVAELVATRRMPAQVLAAVAVEASALLGEPTTLTRFDGDREVLVARSAGTAPPPGATAAAPIAVDGRVWGALTARSERGPLPPGTEARLQQFADLAATAIANAASRAAVTASRARLVATADETRRRLQRDVHDGAQQRLVQTVVTLKLALHAMESGAAAPPALIAEALEHAERATSDLRQVVHGILPAVLSRGGLRAAVGSLVAGLRLETDVDVDVPRLPVVAETTAYFVIAEALANVVKHANATRAEIAATVADRTLTVVVRDDGVGGADDSAGSGLTGLRDRVEASEGRLAITSPAGAGTVVTARLPLPA